MPRLIDMSVSNGSPSEGGTPATGVAVEPDEDTYRLFPSSAERAPEPVSDPWKFDRMHDLYGLNNWPN